MTSNDDTRIVRFAESRDDFDAFGSVCRAYFAWCRDRYSEMPWFIEEVFGHQSFEAELKDLASQYGPPTGRTMIAVGASGIVAGGAYRRLSDSICELKRLYVTDAARGLGLGRRLSAALLASARADGFRNVQLDTANRLVEAITMYKSMGFTPIPPYREYPERLMPHLVFMERAL